jgi:hypothetical protein
MWKRVAILLLAAAGMLWFRHYVPGLHTANEFSRYYAVLAMAELHTARLEPVFERFSPGWRPGDAPLSADVALVDGHFTMDKAPLLALAAVPLHLVLKRWVDPWQRPDLEVTWLALLLVGLPTLVFLGVMLLRRATPGGDWAALVLGLASPLLIYDDLLFGHLPAGLLAFAGYAWLKRGQALPGGLLLGAAVLTDYPAAAPVGLILAWHLASGGTWRSRLLAPAACMLVALGGQLLYDLLAFGDPLLFPYLHKYSPSFQHIHSQGVVGVTLPDLARWFGLLLSPERGLFFLSPVLLAALGGAALLVVDRAQPARERGLPITLLLVVPLALSGFVDWKAGNAAGPRHLLSLLPFLFTPLAVAGDACLASPRPVPRVLLTALALISLAQCWLVHATFPYLSTSLANPVHHQVLPLFLDGCRYGHFVEVPPALRTAVVLLPAALAAGLLLAQGLGDLVGRARLLGVLFSLLLAVLALPALALVGASGPDEARLARREAALVQSLHDCQSTDTAAELVGLLGQPAAATEESP